MSELLTPESYQEFYAECEEIIARVSQYLTEMDKNKQNATLIDSVYRDIHTIKGSAQLFGFSEIGKIAHAMEASLEPARRRNIPLSPDWMDCLLSCLDLIERLIKAKKDPILGYKIDQDTIYLTVSHLIEAATRNFKTDLFVTKDFFVPIETPDRRQISQSSESLLSDHSLLSPETQTHSQNSAQSREKEETSSTNKESASTIRVQVTLLDRLMNLVGEMVLVRNQVLQYSHDHEDFTLLNLSQKLDLVTSELQEEVMKTRMQPIGTILSKFTRFVRDLARDLNKTIEISIEGAETELDKTLIEAIKDPLTHIIRNACDHGIEDAEERRKFSKAPTGKILVSSLQESGQVVVEILDDGRGLDPKKLLSKAIEKKFISQEQAQLLSDREIFQLIFIPGFSTADKVNPVSGRGVGMDVVKTNIEKIGGTVEIKSELNRGTCIRLRIPLTLAIVPALIVRFKNNRFAIPQVKLLELVRVDASETQNKLEFLQGKPVFRLRGNLLPLVSLDEIIEEKSADASQESLKRQTENGVNIIVLATDSGPFGLIVDEILDTADIVVKPLAKFFRKLMIYSGATIMGDGSVSLIFDVLGIAAKANLNQNRSRNQELGTRIQTRGSQNQPETQEMLLFSLKSDGNFTIPLCLVQRLEEFSRQEIEVSGRHRIVQYRDAVLPLISLNQVLGFSAPEGESPPTAQAESEKVPIIVIQKRNRLYGIEVDRIIDIFLADREIEDPIRETPGILGNIILGNEVSTVIDVLSVIDLMTGQVDSKKESHAREAPQALKELMTSKPLRILFAEDTIFFVKQVSKILTSQGHHVTHAGDGAQALEILEKSRPGEFDLVLSDIEMPKLNGFQLAQKIRSLKEFSGIPMIALTTRMRESDIERGKNVGFNRYIEKLKSDQLIEAIQEISHERTLSH